MTECSCKKDNTKCPNYEKNRIYRDRCLHIRFKKWCSWIKLKPNAYVK